MEKINNSDFLNISIDKCGEVYSEVQKNAESHFRCAKILAEANEHPNAIAHLILGTEEMIKALVLFLEYKEFDLRKVDGYKSLFFNHRARHSIIKEFYSVTLFLKKIITMPQPKDKHWLLQTFYYLGQGLDGIVEAKENYEWWDNADALKQNCFYVDYRDIVIAPANFQKSDYDKALKFVKSFKEDIQIVIEAILDMPIVKLKDLSKNLKDANFDKLLGESIKRSHKKKSV